MQIDPIVQKALERAFEARKNSYSPYSKFPVGAALKLKGSDEIYRGCNVENASYGATKCAEQSAFLSAISNNGKKEFDFLVVTADTDDEVQPCALCLQMIAEFCPPDFPIYLANRSEIKRVAKLKELLPSPFDKIPGRS